MNIFNLVPDKEKITYRSYMSSSLTGYHNLSPEDELRVRNSVLDLNIEIKKLCNSMDVELYLPQESANPASNHSDGLSPDEVYLLDRWRVSESDFMILNADNLSFGVGQEMEIANSIAIPTIIFFKKGKTVSRMILGAPCIFIPDGFDKAESYIIYDDEEQLFDKLKDRIAIILESLYSRNIKLSSRESFSKKLKDIRESMNLSYENLSQKTGFSTQFLKLLETEKHYFDQLAIEKDLTNKKFYKIYSNKFTNPGLFILETISHALNINLNLLLPISTNVISFENVPLYKEVLSETNPNFSQLEKVNRLLNFDLHSVAAFDGKKLTKEDIISVIKKIQNDG